MPGRRWEGCRGEFFVSVRFWPLDPSHNPKPGTERQLDDNHAQLVRRVVGNNDRLRDKLDILVKHPNAVRHAVDNVNSMPDGNEGARALRALRKKRPELHARVVAGELSPNAAAIEAGFRHPMISVRADDAAAAVKSLLSRYHTITRPARAAGRSGPPVIDLARKRGLGSVIRH